MVSFKEYSNNRLILGLDQINSSLFNSGNMSVRKRPLQSNKFAKQEFVIEAFNIILNLPSCNQYIVEVCDWVRLFSVILAVNQKRLFFKFYFLGVHTLHNTVYRATKTNLRHIYWECERWFNSAYVVLFRLLEASNDIDDSKAKPGIIFMLRIWI